MTSLQTERLILRPLGDTDIPALVAALDDFDIAKHCASVPHPYSEADAATFVAKVRESRAAGTGFCFGIVNQADGVLIGTCGLHLKNGRFELGYWIAKPFWKLGYATEAADRLLAFGFEVLKADLIVAGWFHDNPASGRVLAKLGFKADHVEPSPCRARGEAVLCNRTMLTRARFGRKRAA